VLLDKWFFLAGRHAENAADCQLLENFLSEHKDKLDVNASDAADASDEHRTALGYAVSNNDAPTIALLLQSGADVEKFGQDASARPLCSAARMRHADAVRALLDGGADIDAAGRNGGTALHFAAGAGSLEVVRILLEAGARLDCLDAEDATAIDWAFEHAEVVQLITEFAAKRAKGSGSGAF
jgi:ankyrin repeat protein